MELEQEQEQQHEHKDEALDFIDIDVDNVDNIDNIDNYTKIIGSRYVKYESKKIRLRTDVSSERLVTNASNRSDSVMNWTLDSSISNYFQIESDLMALTEHKQEEIDPKQLYVKIVLKFGFFDFFLLFIF